MILRNALTLLTTLLLAVSAGAESFTGSLTFGPDATFAGELHFTALDPGETSSAYAPFAGYSQAASSDYTYLYLLDNHSTVGTTTSDCNEHCFISLEIEMLLDPTDPGNVSSVGFDGSNGGEAPSAFGPFSPPDLVFWDFDLAPNFGILPSGGFSAFLRYYSPFGPSSDGGAYITNNGLPPDDVVYITGVTTPVPEPASGGLLALGLAGLAVRRRAQR